VSFRLRLEVHSRRGRQLCGFWNWPLPWRHAENCCGSAPSAWFGKGNEVCKGWLLFQLNQNLRARRDVRQPSLADRRVRESLEYEKFKKHIWQNPVKQFLAKSPEEYPYSSAHSSFRDKQGPVPQRLKPLYLSALPQA